MTAPTYTLKHAALVAAAAAIIALTAVIIWYAESVRSKGNRSEPSDRTEEMNRVLAEREKGEAKAAAEKEKRERAERLQREKDEAEQDARQRAEEKRIGPKRAPILKALEGLSAKRGADAKVSANGNALVFDADVEKCNARILLGIRDQLRAAKLDIAGAELEKLNCGGMGDEIDLRTKDGCAADQHDQLILSDAGVKRDKVVSDMSQLFAGDFILVAMGCDATVLGFAILSGGTARCDADRLGAMVAEPKTNRIFKNLGFVSFRCEPDGPEVKLP